MTASAVPAESARLAKVLHDFQDAMTQRAGALTQEEAVSLLGKAFGHPGWEAAIRDALHPESPTPANAAASEGIITTLLAINELTLQAIAVSLRDAVRQEIVPGWSTADAREVVARALGHSGWHAALVMARTQKPGPAGYMQASGELVGMVATLRDAIRQITATPGARDRLRWQGGCRAAGMLRALGSDKLHALAPARSNAAIELSVVLGTALRHSGLRAQADHLELESHEMTNPDWLFPAWVLAAWPANAELFGKAFRRASVSHAALVCMELEVVPGYASALAERLMRTLAQEALVQGVGRRAAVDIDAWHDQLLVQFADNTLPWELRVVASVPG